MATKTPTKFYFDVNSKKVFDSNGDPVSNTRTKPSIVLSEKSIINIQLITSPDLTPYQELPVAATAEWITDNDFSNPQLQRQLSQDDAWIQSVSGTGEYYYTGDLAGIPGAAYEGSTALTSGSAGTLVANEFGYGNNDGLAADSIYFRLTADIDPDASTEDLFYKLEETTYTDNFLYSDDYNLSGSWYDAETDTYSDPVIADGQLTFGLNANTENFYDRIEGDAQALRTGVATGTVTQVNFYDAGSAEIFVQYRFEFLCRNRFIPDTGVQLEIQDLSVYSKTQVDALLNGKIDLVSPAVSGNAVALNADGSLYDVGYAPGAGGSSTDQFVKVNADDTTADYLSGKVDMAQFEVISDSYVSIMDDGLQIAAVSGLQEALDADASDIGALQPKNLSGETLKTVVTGPEGVGIDDNGVYKATTMQAISNFAVSNFPDVEIENGIQTPASEIDNLDDGIHVTAQRDLDFATSAVFLGHMDGSEGDTSFADSSQFEHSITITGTPVLSGGNEIPGFGTNLLMAADGFSIPDTNFNPGASDFAFCGKFYVNAANVNDTMSLIDIESATRKVMKLYLEGGYLKFAIGVDGDATWSNEDSVEVVVKGYLEGDEWNTINMQRSGNELQIGINSNVIARLDMTSKTLNTPIAGDIRFGIDAADGSLFTGQMDEIILTTGISLVDITANGPTPTTYEEWTDEWYVTKFYDIEPTDENGSARGTFQNADLILSGGEYYLDINHELNETLVSINIADNTSVELNPDQIEYIDVDNARVWFTSYAPISGVWRYFADAGKYGGVNSTGIDLTSLPNYIFENDQIVGHLEDETESWLETTDVAALPNESVVTSYSPSVSAVEIDLDGSGTYEYDLSINTSMTAVNTSTGFSKFATSLITASANINVSFDPTWLWVGARPASDTISITSGSSVELVIRSSNSTIIAAYQDLV